MEKPFVAVIDDIKQPKQADTVMAHVLFETDASPEVRARSFAYYEEVTTHDSSLSKCMFCIAACRLGFRAKARQYFGDSLMIALYNTCGNTRNGIHAANLGGSYLAVVYGFVGLKLDTDGIRIDPFLPKGWTGICLRFQYQGSRLRFKMKGQKYQLTLLSGPPVTVRTPLVEKRLMQVGDCVGAGENRA